MKFRRYARGLGSFIVVALLPLFVSCSGNASGTASLSTVCPDVILFTTLISPAPGATGVSPSIGRLVFSSNVFTGAQFMVTLTPASGSPIVVTATPTQDTQITGSDIAIPLLASQTTYTVSIHPLLIDRCGGFSFPNNVWFSTQ